jgi:hypothetical protein
MADDDDCTSYSNMLSQDFDLENFDFDAFLTSDPSQATDTTPDVKQKPASAFSTGKKRRSDGAVQPCINRKRIKHSHVCAIHQPPSSKVVTRCYGTRLRKVRREGTKCKNIVATYVEEQLPVCKQHRTQVMKMKHCEAILECGFTCNEIVPWKPHGYPLCESHWSQGECYFLALPVEIRLMIYGYLLPDKLVPHTPEAKWKRNRNSTAIFRVHKTIHEEIVDSFYGQAIFDIGITNLCNGTPSISMCYAFEGLQFKSALSDYQMQLMLLERQNMQRVTQARAAASRSTPPQPPLRKTLSKDAKFNFTPWQPSLSLRYFQQIRSFHIKITFDTRKNFPYVSNGSQSAEKILVEANRNVLCDYLHRVVECLVTNNQIPLRKVDISISIHGIKNDDENQANSEAITHCQGLIKPIQRLRTNIANIVSLTRIDNGNKKVQIFPVHAEKDSSIARFVQSCCLELTDQAVPPPKSLVLTQFDQLTAILSQMSQYPFWRIADIEEMEFLLNNGRSAREANDIKAMMSVFRSASDMLKTYHFAHQDFMNQMKQSIDLMRTIKK